MKSSGLSNSYNHCPYTYGQVLAPSLDAIIKALLQDVLHWQSDGNVEGQLRGLLCQMQLVWSFDTIMCENVQLAIEWSTRKRQLSFQIQLLKFAIGSGPRYMNCVTLFCKLHESENSWTYENCMCFSCNSHMSVFCVQFLHVSVFSDSRNVQKLATKSDTLGHCLVCHFEFPPKNPWNNSLFSPDFSTSSVRAHPAGGK